MNEFNYSSPLKPFIQGLIQEKRSLGYKYDDSATRLLYKFDQFYLKHGCSDALISKELVHMWIQKKPTESLATLNNRVCAVRQLASYMNRLGISAYILPKNTTPQAPNYTPYIFSDKEVAALFTQADACHYCSAVPLRHKIMPLLFRMLYSCGLRISEALNLRLKDVNLETGVLIIIDGKFNKDRLIPMESNLLLRCCDYAKKVHLSSDGYSYFFPAPNGQSITRGNAYKNFRRFLWQARISHGGWGKGPRLHDIRFTFCVHCLRRWVFQGKDLAAYLPILKTYIGHESFRDTAKYLSLTADLYPDITAKVEKAFGHVIPSPGGCHNETH